MYNQIGEKEVFEDFDEPRGFINPGFFLFLLLAFSFKNALNATYFPGWNSRRYISKAAAPPSSQIYLITLNFPKIAPFRFFLQEFCFFFF